ncbi:MAG: hypothetical protein KME28_26070 [Pelatocladus maniniholoensis HA4357-MV3]|jgi:hypothetical protein|uniref:Uncharacterized protein n=1 Tax=Pelatocladus maniniholoensis HA4357-MV3 TaxID=1117104 RepID=A0A9E3HDA0_9NOST|nr:hypothetical protein [Pelatocladus maniniholoensis HA4357-MV3]
MLPLILQLLAAPFGADAVNPARRILGRILIERGANHLTVEQVQGTLKSAISLLALQAVQEKAKVHGWLGNQIQQAHTLLVKAIFEPSEQDKNYWIGICRIPEHLLKLDLPHPEYNHCEAPGVFRYENKTLLDHRKEDFLEFLEACPDYMSPAQALEEWLKQTIPYLFELLNTKLQDSIKTCFAIQLTQDNSSALLENFL